jgi:beta-glucosidase
VPREENQARIAEAVKVAARADLVLLVVGDNLQVTREAVAAGSPGDRSSLGLYGDQDALVEAVLATGKPVITLLLNGRPLAATRLAEASRALLEGWYLGQEGGTAFANVLFGRVNPGGKLTVSFPRSVGELPVFYNRHPSSDLNVYIEGRRAPLFPFGHGLSYTRFEISEPRLVRSEIAPGEPAALDVDVTNTGSRAGDEVVQVYLRDDVSTVPRPVLELKAFRRVTLAAGEKRTLRFDLPADALAFWDIEMKWRVEPGTFTVSAGASSAALKSTKLTVRAADVN